MFEQISIWDILGEPEEKPQDFKCDTCKYEVNGYCDYDPHGQQLCVLGSAYEKRNPEWKRLYSDQDTILDYSTLTKYEPKKDEPPAVDHISKGAVDGVMAWIGYGTYVSGWNEEFTELLPIYWKERHT